MHGVITLSDATPYAKWIYEVMQVTNIIMLIHYYKYVKSLYTGTRKGPAQARVSTDIFHDGLRRETCSDTRITREQYPIILAVHSVHFANFLRGIYAAEWL